MPVANKLISRVNVWGSRVFSRILEFQWAVGWLVSLDCLFVYSISGQRKYLSDGLGFYVCQCGEITRLWRCVVIQNSKALLARGIYGFLGLLMLGCSSGSPEMVAGNIQAVNHTAGAINWLSVNGYRADGVGGRSCCVVMPAVWRPGLKADIEWEVDPNPTAKMPSVTSAEFLEVYARHAKNYVRHSAVVDVPEWPGTESCDLKVHFLTCNQVQVTTSCWAHGSPNYPIQYPDDMQEPTVCPE